MNAKVVTIVSDVLTVLMAILGAVDTIWLHWNILQNPIFLSVLAVLGGLGIHQVTTGTTVKAS